MPDYKKLMGAAETAISIMIDAQLEYEEMYVSAPEGELQMLAQPTGRKRDARDVKKEGYSDPALPLRK